MLTRTASSVQVTGFKVLISLSKLCLSRARHLVWPLASVPLCIAGPVSPHSKLPEQCSATESLCLPPGLSASACGCAWEPPVSTFDSCSVA